MRQWILFAATAALLSASAGHASACACCGTWKVTGVAADDQLNIRRGPGVRFATVGAIPSGSACVLKTRRCSGSWCRVRFADQRGWAHTKYLRYYRGP